MRVLHIVKTSDGALWAARQASELVRKGVDVHVALPHASGRMVPVWRAGGSVIHIENLCLPVDRPALVMSRIRRAKELVSAVGPDLIHSHFVTTTMLLRLALGRHHRIPRLFQVPGPLHLEHGLFRAFEMALAGPNDYWIASSRYIRDQYAHAGIPPDRLFVSYYGTETRMTAAASTPSLRQRLGISADEYIIGNANWMYPPKYYLGQRVGLKCHEDVIDALATVTRRRKDIVGVLIGKQWGSGDRYQRILNDRARESGGRIVLPGYMPEGEVRKAWLEFDCAVHVPLSENCGGVIEPLSAGVPTIASEVGGLPEVVVNGVTGRVIPARQPAVLAETIFQVVSDLSRYRRLASVGQQLVSVMFDVKRTAEEVLRIYEHVLDPAKPAPVEFDSRQYLRRTAGICPAAFRRQ